MDTNLKGTITELKCKTYFLELGYIVSTPDSPTRYDFMLDKGEKVLKVQGKTSHTDADKTKILGIIIKMMELIIFALGMKTNAI